MRLPHSLLVLTATAALSFATQSQSKAATYVARSVEPLTATHTAPKPEPLQGRLSQALAAARQTGAEPMGVTLPGPTATPTLDVVDVTPPATAGGESAVPTVASLSVVHPPVAGSTLSDPELTEPLVPVNVFDRSPAPAVVQTQQRSVTTVHTAVSAPKSALVVSSAATAEQTVTLRPVVSADTEPPASYQELAPGVYVPAAYVSPATPPLQPVLAAASQAVLASGSVTNESPRYPLLQVATLTSPFGTRWGRLHAGVDLGVAVGTPVVASLSGQVMRADWNGGYGNCVVLRHRNGTIETLYGHLSRVAVQPGQVVQQGQIIGWSGASGYVTGPHLHFELRQLTAAGWHAVDINAIVAAAAQSLTAGTVATPATPAATDVTLRVALVTHAKQISIGAATPALLSAADGSAIATLSPLQPIELLHTSNGLYAGHQRLPSLLRLTPQPGGAVAVNGVWYRGTILIADLPGGLSAINWVPLEDYLVSVVGSEAYPSWSAAALQAQAIAARSYALWYRYNPANAWYDLAAGTEYQAYEGLTKEFTTTAQAVAATQGLVLTSVTGNVLQAQYAATQAISDAYHGGQGLSQWGAAALAASGYDCLTILGQFYPGARLSRVGG